MLPFLFTFQNREIILSDPVLLHLIQHLLVQTCNHSVCVREVMCYITLLAPVIYRFYIDYLDESRWSKQYGIMNLRGEGLEGD
jgi:hypothetical protein